MTRKGTWRQVLICLRHPIPSPPLYTLYENKCTHVLIHTGKGGGGRWTSEKGASSQEGSKIPTLQTVSLVYKLFYIPLKTTFRVWCLCIWSMLLPLSKLLLAPMLMQCFCNSLPCYWLALLFENKFTKMPTLVFFWFPRNLSNPMDRQAHSCSLRAKSRTRGSVG